MTKQELEARLGYEITWNGWEQLEKMYMGCDLNKNDFAKLVKAGAKVYKAETSQEYGDFLERLVIEELEKDIGFEVTFKSKKNYGGSKLYVYTFVDCYGNEWEREVPYRAYMNIASQNPNMRARRS